MGRPRIIKNETAEVGNVSDNVAQETQEEQLVMVKTTDRDVVAKALELKYEIVHMSGCGTVHSPKVFFLNVLESKLKEQLTNEQIEAVEPADKSEIEALVKQSRERGNKEYQESGARRRKLNAEIAPSEFYA